MSDILLAVFVGAAFGFALNRVGATNPQYIINMVRLTDMHLMKVIIFAVGMSSALLFAGMSAGLIDPGHLSVKATHLGVILGGMMLGVGFAIAGYCPGTGIGAAATGRLDGIVFVIGGLVGAFAYALAYAPLKATGLLDNLFGGKVSIAATPNEKFGSLVDILPGSVTAFVLALVLIFAAIALPKTLGARQTS